MTFILGLVITLLSLFLFVGFVERCKHNRRDQR